MEPSLCWRLRSVNIFALQIRYPLRFGIGAWQEICRFGHCELKAVWVLWLWIFNYIRIVRSDSKPYYFWMTSGLGKKKNTDFFYTKLFIFKSAWMPRNPSAGCFYRDANTCFGICDFNNLCSYAMRFSSLRKYL